MYPNVSECIPILSYPSDLDPNIIIIRLKPVLKKSLYSLGIFNMCVAHEF